jgi:GNAT superfamily N-acetyltransferase
MRARSATPHDAPELLRLTVVLFESMGFDCTGGDWITTGEGNVRERLGTDMAAFVVDHPDSPGRLVALAAGTISARLPTPANPSGLAGYVQWVCTDVDFRGRGLARLVMAALLEWFDQREIKTVELHATPVAEPLYLALGFDDSGPRALRRRR